MGEALFKRKNEELLQLEATANAELKKNQTELAYRNLNSGFFNLEKAQLEDTALEKWKKEHEDKKRAIETTWHRNADAEYKALTKSVRGNQKSRSYYRPFSLKQLETFIKYSERGGNSEAYNDVATELELYNRIMEKGNPLEGFGILLRLQKSSNDYVNSKSPNSTKGKIRKAIISVISEKVSSLIEEQRTQYKTKADTLFEEVQAGNVTDEKITEAFRAHYGLIYQVLNGNIELSSEEIEKLDSNMVTVTEYVMNQKVDESQGNNMSTKFFNALGWSSNDARLVSEMDLENSGKEMKKSPLKKRMYHAINPYGDHKDARDAGRQLAGVKKQNNRIFFGLGRFGKGIYTSAQADGPDGSDIKAEKNSWGYGDRIGAVQLVMTLNEHARMMSYTEFQINKEKLFDRKFSKLSDLLEQERSSKSGFRDFLTMKASFFGYNTLIDRMCGISGVDYYVTTDRKALSICNEMRIRTELHNTDFDSIDTEYLRREG